MHTISSYQYKQMKAFNPPKRRGKSQKGRIGAIEQNQARSSFGRYVIKACECARLTPNTIEAVRRTITRFLKRRGKIWVCIYPDIAITEKPLEMRMGKGKGPISSWVFRVKAGQKLFEIEGVSQPLAKQAAKHASYRLPIKSKFSLHDV